MHYLNINPDTTFQTQDATDGTITTAEITLRNITFNPLQAFFEKSLELKNRTITSADIASMTQMLGVVGIVGLADMQKLHAIIVIPTRSVFLKS